MKKIVYLILAIIGIILGILFFNYYRITPKDISGTQSPTDLTELKGYKKRLAQSIRYKTISYEDSVDIDYSQFPAFHEYLKEAYPEAFDLLEIETVNNYTLLLKWPGKDPQLKPGIIMAHQDVVPVSDDTKYLWQYPPFEGIIKNDTLYGRGSVDDKVNLMAQLEAVNFLAKSNFTPERDLYFVFGHDEELGGNQGAKAAAELLEKRGIKADFVIDEGGYVSNGDVPGIEKSVALIGTSEKGFINLELSVNIAGGHSSMPDRNNAINVLSKAITDLSNQPFPAELSPSVLDFMAHVSPYSSFINRLAMSNLWLFKPLVYKLYAKSPKSDAMIRTTMVPTIIKGGEKDNVIPNIVTANINYRSLPGTGIEQVVAHTEKVINNPDVSVKVREGAREGSHTSPINTEAYQKITEAVTNNFENTISSPFLMIGGTDSKHFDVVSRNIYKFSPMKNPIGFHGVNEQLYLGDYKKTINFYVDFIKAL